MPLELADFEGRRLDGVLRVLSCAFPADSIARSTFVRKVLLDPNFDPAGAKVALLDGEPAGFGLSLVRRFPLEDAPSDAGTGYITLLGVDPQRRRGGAGGLLLAELERYLQGRGCSTCSISPYAPGYFTPGVDVACAPDGLEFLTHRGYAVVSRPLAMERPLLRLDWPAGVVARERALIDAGVLIEPYRPEMAPMLFAFLRSEFPGDWQRFAREAIGRIEQGGAPTRLWIASTPDAVVGYAHHDGERFGPIGVARSSRGAGVGVVLMYRTLQAMRNAGLRIAWFMWTDDRTADGFYRPAGFVEARRFAVLRKELA